MSKPLTFDEFSSVSKQDWIEKAKKDIKQPSLETLQWKINNTLAIDPYYSIEDIRELDHSFLLDRPATKWKTGEFCNDINEYDDAVRNGVTGPVISPPEKFDLQYWNHIFSTASNTSSDVHIVFSSIETATSYLQQLTDNVHPDPFSSCTCFFHCTDRGQFSLLQKCHANWKCFPIDVQDFHKGSDSVLDELYQIRKQLEFLIEQANHKGIDVFSLLQKTHITVSVSTSYLLEISKLRAIRLIWKHVLENNHIPVFHPYISVRAPHTSFGNDEHDHLIHATTLAMSGILGGADHLVVSHPDYVDRPFHKKAVRQTQLILKHECQLDQYIDPAQGSYYLEYLTATLCNQTISASL